MFKIHGVVDLLKTMDLLITFKIWQKFKKINLSIIKADVDVYCT